MKQFKKIYIEITNVCNLECSFCPKTSREKGMMTLADFGKIVKKCKPHTKYINLHLMGEPLLHPNLKEIIEVLRENDLLCNITTNGTLIKKAGIDILEAGGVNKISFSLHSFEANEIDIPFETYIKNITDFCKVASASGTICALRLWNVKGENQMNKRIMEIIECETGANLSSVNETERNSDIKLADKFFLQFDNKFNWPKEGLNEGERGFCYGLRDHIGVLVDGTVVPCCLDNDGVISLGNIKEKTLEEIINSKRAKEIYNGFSGRKRVEKLCVGCGYINKFEG